LERIRKGQRIFLPLTPILETGNHIGQMSEGTRWRRCAESLRDLVRKAREAPSTVPFSPLGDWLGKDVEDFLDAFPDWVGKGIGLGDLTIQRD
jgi:hypothetical protein